MSTALASLLDETVSPGVVVVDVKSTQSAVMAH
jgi:hypothetical protein